MRNRRFVVTSVVRKADPGQTSGLVRVMDLGGRQVLGTTAIPESTYRHLDGNPRGGLRGARGVSSWGDRVVVANTERLLVLDSSWEMVDEFTHPWMGGVHDILAGEDGIWVTCTAADLLLKLSWSGEVLFHWEWRRDAGLRKKFGFRGLSPFRRDLDYRNPEVARESLGNTIHLNAVGRSSDSLLLSFGRVLSPAVYWKRRATGTLLALAGKVGIKERVRPTRGPGEAEPRPGPAVSEIRGSSFALVRLWGDGRTEVLERAEDTRVPNHNVLDVGGWIVFNDTNAGQIVGIPPDGSKRRVVSIPGDSGFVRGLEHLGGMEFLVGSKEPLAVYHVDLASNRVLSSLELEGAANESVYGISSVPDSFHWPAASPASIWNSLPGNGSR
ncbi:hypothetical protein ACFL0I_03945 [Gemmatimonadota bacterium]